MQTFAYRTTSGKNICCTDMRCAIFNLIRQLNSAGLLFIASDLNVSSNNCCRHIQGTQLGDWIRTNTFHPLKDTASLSAGLYL